MLDRGMWMELLKTVCTVRSRDVMREGLALQ